MEIGTRGAEDAIVRIQTGMISGGKRVCLQAHDRRRGGDSGNIVQHMFWVVLRAPATPRLAIPAKSHKANHAALEEHRFLGFPRR